MSKQSIAGLEVEAIVKLKLRSATAVSLMLSCEELRVSLRRPLRFHSLRQHGCTASNYYFRCLRRPCICLPCLLLAPPFLFVFAFARVSRYLASGHRKLQARWAASDQSPDARHLSHRTTHGNLVNAYHIPSFSGKSVPMMLTLPPASPCSASKSSTRKTSLPSTFLP